MNARFRSPQSFVAFAFCGAILLLFSGWGNLLSITGRLTQRVDVEISGLDPADARLISLWYSSVDGEKQLSRYLSPFHWRLDLWLPELYISAPQAELEKISSLEVRVGGERHVFRRPDFASWTQVETPRTVSPITRAVVVSHIVPLPHRGPIAMVNWPPGETASGYVLRSLVWLPLTALGLWAMYFLLRRSLWLEWICRRLTSAASIPDPSRLWTFGGLTFVLLSLATLEFRQPYYFTQDDNYAQFLPVINGACGAAFSGEWPLWNPYQYLGAPVLTLGVYALTYPVTYLAWAIAYFAFGNEFLTIEIFAIAHIAAGYWITRRVLSELGMRPLLAVSGAVCFVLSGFSLVFGRSWYYMLPVLVWAPLLVLAVQRLIAGNGGWRWALSTGLAVGLFFHAGNAQMWCYGVMFFVIALGTVAYSGVLPWKRALWSLPALLCGLAMAAPVLLLQMGETSNIDRNGGSGASIASALPHMLLPLGGLLPHPDGIGLNQLSARGEMFFIGTPFALATALGICALLGTLILCRVDTAGLRKIIGANPWLLCAALAWIFGLGKTGLLWSLLSFAPGFDKFNVPAKFIGFLSLFAVMGGGLFLERNRSLMRKAVLWTIALSAFGLTYFHVLRSTQAFYDYAGGRYPALPLPLAAALNQPPFGRVLAIAPDRTPNPRAPWSLFNNYATAARVLSVEGYDPLVEKRPEDEEVARRLSEDTRAAAAAYGVRWILVDTSGSRWQFGDDPTAWALEVTNPERTRWFDALEPDSHLVAETGGFRLYELQHSAAMAFRGGDPETALPVETAWSGMRVTTAGLPIGSNVVLNVLGRQWISLRTESGTPIPWTRDSWGRVSFRLPEAAGRVMFRYSPPALRAGGIATGLLIFALLTGWALSMAARREQIPDSISASPVAAAVV